MNNIALNPASQSLLDFSTPFDQTKLATLEQVISAMYSPNRKDVSHKKYLTWQIEQANELLNMFKSHEDAWKTVDVILQNAQNPNTKFFGL